MKNNSLFLWWILAPIEAASFCFVLRQAQQEKTKDIAYSGNSFTRAQRTDASNY